MKKNKKRKILVVTGTRAEYGLFRSALFKLRQSKHLEVKLLATGMHTLKKFGFSLSLIKKDMPVDCVVSIRKSDNMVSALSQEIDGIYRYVNKNNFKAILVVGDRDEPFAAATVGVHLNIPIIHVSGGDISGPSVDHLLRNAISIFSKLHLVQTHQSMENVIKLGIDAENIHVVGSAGLDGLRIKEFFSRKKLVAELGLKPNSRWFLTSMHPTPFEALSFANQINPVIAALKKFKQIDEKIIIYPNSDTGCDVFINAIASLPLKNSGFHLFKNLERKYYLSLLRHSVVLIGNSSSGLVEAGFLKTPFINVGNRQRGREKGVNVISATHDSRQILDGIDVALSEKFRKKLKETPPAYKGGNVSGRIVNKIENFLNNYYA